MDQDAKDAFKQFMMDLPTRDAECFSAVQGGDFKGMVEVTPAFYDPIIKARKSLIGG